MVKGLPGGWEVRRRGQRVGEATDEGASEGETARERCDTERERQSSGEVSQCYLSNYLPPTRAHATTPNNFLVVVRQIGFPSARAPLPRYDS